MAAAEVVDEEHYVLRVLDAELADALRSRLRESDAAVPSETQLIFEGQPRHDAAAQGGGQFEEAGAA